VVHFTSSFIGICSKNVESGQTIWVKSDQILDRFWICLCYNLVKLIWHFNLYKVTVLLLEKAQLTFRITFIWYWRGFVGSVTIFYQVLSASQKL